MKDLTKTASILDKFLKILSICIKISAVAMVVGLCVIGISFLFDLPPQVVGTDYNQAHLGFVSFTVAEGVVPDHRILWGNTAMELFLTLLCLIPAHFIAKTLRSILAPMKDGEPFREGISKKLNYLARYTCSLGIALNLQNIISNILTTKAFDLPNLLHSDAITHVTFNFVFDLSFLVVAGILLLLSYVFQYGEQLQQLSDETL